MMEHKTTFTMVSYNRRDQVKDLLQSVLAGDKVPEELIVVDNASSDGTVEMLARDFPQVRVIANRENLMGSMAVNQGIAAATGEFVFASADDNVVDRGCVRELYDAMLSHPDAALVAPVMYFYDAPDRIWYAGCDLNITTGLTNFLTEIPKEKVVETTCAPNCYMVRRSVLQTIGGQDVATFPFHHEEADWSFRASEAGFKNYVARDAREFHRTPVPKYKSPIGSGDFSIDDPMRAYYHARSRALLARRHAKGLSKAAFFAFFYPATVLAYVLICAVQSKQHVKTSVAFVRGAIHGLTMTLPPPPPPLLDKNGAPAPSNF
ncbi:MAG: glycosyltransferase family 2 protein [Candidatus Tumulicola sp.]